MKVKIYVSSNSGIKSMTGIPSSVESVPVLVSFNDGEVYEDGTELSTEAFYNRLRFDEVKASFDVKNYSDYATYIEKARNAGYESVLFLLSAKEYGNAYVPLKLACNQYPDYPVTLYSSEMVAYPLAYMALGADKMFKEEKSMEEVKAFLDYTRDNSYLYLFSPDVKNENGLFPESPGKTPFLGKMYFFSDGHLTRKKRNRKDPVEEVMSYAEELKNVLFFGLYTDMDSIYYKKMKEIMTESDFYPIPPVMSSDVGAYAFGMGFIRLKTE